jgi:hypothetical protein
MRVVQAGMRMVVVYEQEPIAGDPESRTLVFEAPDSVVKLAHFPADWRKLKDEELLALPKSQA